MELRKKIINTSTHLFLSMGFKNVTMNQISEELGISKRTLYEIFDDKDHLINESLTYIFLENNNEMIKIIENHNNIFDAIIEIGAFQIKTMRKVPKFILEEINRISKESKITSMIINKLSEDRWAPFAIIEKGMEQGIFRKDINIKLVNLFLQQIIILFHDNEIFDNNNFSNKEIQESIFLPYYRGLCTEKGLKLMNEHTDKINNQMQYCFE